MQWVIDCDYKGNELTMKVESGQDCGPACKTTKECTHFAWNEFNGKDNPECWLKKGPVSESDAYYKKGTVCGYIPQRGNLFLIISQTRLSLN